MPSHTSTFSLRLWWLQDIIFIPVQISFLGYLLHVWTYGSWGVFPWECISPGESIFGSPCLTSYSHLGLQRSLCGRVVFPVKVYSLQWFYTCLFSILQSPLFSVSLRRIDALDLFSSKPCRGLLLSMFALVAVTSNVLDVHLEDFFSLPMPTSYSVFGHIQI